MRPAPTPAGRARTPAVPPARHTRAVRLVFPAYVLALLAATLWPNLRIESQTIERPDLLAHLVVFGGFQILLTACGFFGRPASLRNIALATAAGLVFAGLNEAAQAIPALGRTSAVDDYLANALGIAAAAACWTLAALLRRARVQRHAARDR